VLALGGKRRKELLDIVSLGKTVQSVCLVEIYMEHFREDMDSVIFLL
jgi:hypothetical protein